MKKFCLLSVIACFFAGIVFTGCDNDDDGPGVSSINSITAKVEKGSEFDLDVVKAVMIFGDEEEYIVAEGNYTNGGFTIILPSEVDDRYLEGIGDDMPEGIKISNASARIGAINLEGYKNDVYEDYFFHAKIEISDKIFSLIAGGFVYVDRDVTVTGSHSEPIEDSDFTLTVTFNTLFKRGWNAVYASLAMSEKEPNIITVRAVTKNPGGLKWYYAGGEMDLLDLLPIQPVTIGSAINGQQMLPIFQKSGIQ